MSLTKYEHYQELFEASPAAFPGKLGGQHSKVWKTRRRADGKIFLAQEFCDDLDIIHDVQESLLRLLNHPNVINLVDIVKDSKNLEGGIDFAVWEWCDQGSLSRLMWHADTAKQADMPESLCWHVLSGVAKALMYLHTGVKHTFPFDRTMVQDDDWHPVMIADISPSKSE
ncbi:MAG: hypothetical protein M1833_003125 [Piccolia ochrophora]|nr:MAG: hypothetical protein M1833_003125 [Piccolia ochrophora]